LVPYVAGHKISTIENLGVTEVSTIRFFLLLGKPLTYLSSPRITP
jgi:hypothetical protein